MVISPLDIFANKGAIFLINQGVVLPHPRDIIYHKTSFRLHNSYFQILDTVCDICCEMGFQLVAFFDFIENDLER